MADRNQIQWLQPAIERFSSAYAFWSKVSNAGLSRTVTSNESNLVLPQRQQSANRPPMIGDQFLSLMLNHPNCRGQQNALVLPNYQIKNLMMALWVEMICDNVDFYNKFHKISPAVDSLHKEIVQFYEYMKPLPIERIVRKRSIKRISDIISEKLDGVNEVSCFGSYKTGLCLPTSDIDLVVFGQWSNPPLTELKDILIEAGVSCPNNVKVLDRASVPILKLTDQETGIRFDISFNMPNGTRSIEVIKQFLIEFPPLRYLAIVLKHFLLQRCLNEVFTGGISSYTLIMMSVSLLQMHPRMNCRIQSKCNLGQLLLDFFELYGRSFNYQRVGIRVRDGGSYVPKAQLISQFNAGSIIPRGLSMLSLEDPLDSKNDIGRGSYATFAVRLHFENAFAVLEKCIQILDSDAYRTKDGTFRKISILGRIVGINTKMLEYRNFLIKTFDTSNRDSDQYSLTTEDTQCSVDTQSPDDSEEDDSTKDNQRSNASVQASLSSSYRNNYNVYKNQQARFSRNQFYPSPNVKYNSNNNNSNDDRYYRSMRYPSGRRFFNRHQHNRNSTTTTHQIE